MKQRRPIGFGTVLAAMAVVVSTVSGALSVMQSDWTNAALNLGLAAGLAILIWLGHQLVSGDRAVAQDRQRRRGEVFRSAAFMDDSLLAAIEHQLLDDMRKTEADLGITHVDGVPWYQAPLPWRWHRCRAHTTCVADRVRRCACGGLSMDLHEDVWIQRNSRRGA